MKTFDTYDDVDGLRKCRKTALAHAKKMDQPFRVQTEEGLMEGEAGDYLMQGAEGELYICAKEIFEKTYTFQEDDS